MLGVFLWLKGEQNLFGSYACSSQDQTMHFRMHARTIAHCCFKNYDFSKKIGKILLQGVNKTSVDELKPFATCM